MPEPLLTVEQVADLLQVPVQSLYKWRAKGYGPAPIKVGKYLRYRPESVDAFLVSLEPESKLIDLESERRARAS